MKIVLSTLFVLLSFVFQAFAQELSNLEIIKRTIAASGGETWRRPQTLQLSGTAVLCLNGETKNCRQMTTYKMWRVFPSENNEAHKANGKVRFDAFENDRIFFRAAFDGQKTTNEFSEEAKKQADNFRWDNAFGFSILRFADGEGFALIRMTDDQIENFPCYFIRVIDPKKNETVFGIDKKSFRVRSVAFDTPLGFHQRIYSDFKWNKTPKFLQPTRVRLFYKGVKTADIHWQDFKVNESIADDVFTPNSQQSTANIRQ